MNKTERQSALEFSLWRITNGYFTPIMYKKGDDIPDTAEYIKWLESEIEKEKKKASGTLV